MGPLGTGLRRALAIAFAIVVAAACGTTPAANAPSASAAKPKTESVTFATTLELNTLDGINSNIVESSHTVYGTLVRILPDGGIEPDLATKWTANADATKWTFTIRDGVKFHDGSTLSANDVVWSYNTTLATDKSPNRGNISPFLV